MRKIFFLVTAALIAAPVAATAQNVGPCNTPECIARYLDKLERDAAREAARDAEDAAKDAADCARRQARGAKCRPN